MKKLADTVEYIGRKVTGGYKRIEEGVVNGYRKMENGAVQGFQAVTDKCVECCSPKAVRQRHKPSNGSSKTPPAPTIAVRTNLRIPPFFQH